jgi:hypothetical protein
MSAGFREPASRRKSFTTGMVAKLCGVASRTVAKWCDVELLPCYRIPGSTDRRVRRADLLRFMVDNRLPMPAELLAPVVLFVGRPAVDVSGYQARGTADSWQAGEAVSECGAPAAAVLDCNGTPRWELTTIAGRLRVLVPRPKILAVATEDMPEFDGADVVLVGAVSDEVIVETLCRLLAMPPQNNPAPPAVGSSRRHVAVAGSVVARVG